MKPGEFNINNINSDTLGNSRIQLRPEINVPARKSTMIQVPGVSGDYVLDEDAYENTDMNLEIIFKTDTENEVGPMRELITYSFDSGGYIPLELYFDPERIYHVKTTSGPNFRMSGQWPLIVLYAVDLTVKPFKTYKEDFSLSLPADPLNDKWWTEDTTGYSYIDNGETLKINNPAQYSAQPIITLYGVGNITLTVNGKNYEFQDVDDHIVVDSTVEEAYKFTVEDGIVNRNDKMFSRTFPYLIPGDNTISATGATTIVIEGRWRTLVS